MAYIDFKKLKGRVSIEDILAHYGLFDELEESAQGYEGACPFCGSGSFKVNVERSVWFCFGECKSATEAKAEGGGERNGGNILDFVARKEGVSVKSAAAKIASWFPKAGESTRPDARDRAMSNGKETGEDEPKKATQGNTVRTVTSKPTATEGEGIVTPEAVEAFREEDLTGRKNKPLDFTLKSLTVEHPVLDGLGLARATLETFGVGYFTGKGMMHDKVVIPFHNAEGLLVAYAGYAPETRAYTYPKDFDRRLELYNVWRTSNIGVEATGVVIVTDLLSVLRLHELGVKRVVALPTETLFAPQLVLIRDLVGDGGLIDFAPWTKEYVDTLAALLPHFHVRLHRYYNGSEDEFLSQVVHSLGWWPPAHSEAVRVPYPHTPLQGILYARTVCHPYHPRVLWDL